MTIGDILIEEWEKSKKWEVWSEEKEVRNEKWDVLKFYSSDCEKQKLVVRFTRCEGGI